MKFIIFSQLFLFSLLNIKCDGKKVDIQVKIKDDWEEKREFIYLKNVELKERFMLKIIEKTYNFRYCSPDYNMEGFLHPVELKIKNDWEEKREFIYLKNVELQERFDVKIIEKCNNQHNSFKKNSFN